MTTSGLPFAPPGFHPVGPSNTLGAPISVEHLDNGPLAGTTFTLPTVDMTVFNLTTDRRQVRNLINALAGANGCECGVDIPNTQVLISRINNSGAPTHAVPFILQSSAPWSSYEPSQTGPAPPPPPPPADTSERMSGIDHGTLEQSQYAPAPGSPRQTQLPAPRMDSPSPALSPSPAPAVPTIFQTRFGNRTGSPAPNTAPVAPIAFNPRTANTTTLGSQHQGKNELLAHINALVSNTNAQVAKLQGEVRKVNETVDDGFINNNTLFKIQEKAILALQSQVASLTAIVQTLAVKPQAPPPRAPVALPKRPPAPTAIDKGKGKAPPPSSESAPTPKPFNTTQKSVVVNVRDLPAQGRAPAPTPPTATSGTETAPEQRRRTTRNPNPRNVAPAPGHDDAEEEESDSGNLSEPLNWASTAAMKKGDKWTTVDRKKVQTPKPGKPPPARGPKAPAGTPPHKRDLRLIATRDRKYKREPVKGSLICNAINKALMSAGVIEKSGSIAIAKTSRTNNIVLEVDGNHNSTTMLPYLDIVAKGLRNAVGYPIEKLTRDLERVFLHVQGIPLNHNHPSAGARNWEAEDWDLRALESARIEFGKVNAGINALDRPRIIGNFANLKAKKATTASFVFGVERNEAAEKALKDGRVIFSGTTKTVVEWFPQTYRTFCERCLNTHHLRGMCVNPPTCKYCWGRHESPKHVCPVLGCNVVGECVKHVERKCINCDGFDHYAGADNCPARGDAKGFNPDNPRHIVNDPTTGGHHRQPRLHDPSRRGQKAIDQKPAAKAVTITDSSESERESRRRPSQRKRNLKKAPTSRATRHGSPLPTPRKAPLTQVPQTPNRRAAQETLRKETIGIVDLVDTTIPDSQESGSMVPSSIPAETTPATTTAAAIHPAPKTPSAKRIMRDADTAQPATNPLSDDEFEDMMEREIEELGRQLGDWAGQNHLADRHWSHLQRWCIHRRKKHLQGICIFGVSVHKSHYLAGADCPCDPAETSGRNPCKWVKPEEPPRPPPANREEPPSTETIVDHTTKKAGELADTSIPTTQEGHHWTHKHQWCGHYDTDEMNAPCPQVVMVDQSHYRTIHTGCNPANENPLEPCPVFQILVSDAEENRRDFERNISATIQEHHPGTTVEITSTGRVIINGEDTPSQYLNRADGTGIHPNCHCKISYMDNLEKGSCPADCPCYHRSPTIAFIVIENNVVTRIPFTDGQAILEARRRLYNQGH